MQKAPKIKAALTKADKDVGALVVLDGIVTEQDYARNVFLKKRASPQTLVGEIAERNVVCVAPDKSIEECTAIMGAKRVRHLPVINNDELLGIVSIGDLVKGVISGREFVIEQLASYPPLAPSWRKIELPCHLAFVPAVL